MECRKVKFLTQEYAEYHIDKHKKRAIKKGKKARSYECHICKCWHITSRVDFREVIKDNDNLFTRNKELEEKMKEAVKEGKALICADPVVMSLKKKIKAQEVTITALRKSVSELTTNKIQNENNE
jgi:hypothetical protein